MLEEFTLTEDHIMLARRMYVSWDDTEYGAPAIDPKRPYGNSDVENDIHEILTGETIGLVTSSRDELTPAEAVRYNTLHEEMQTALQIILSAGTFQPGVYSAPASYRFFYSNWQRVPQPLPADFAERLLDG